MYIIYESPTRHRRQYDDVIDSTVSKINPGLALITLSETRPWNVPRWRTSLSIAILDFDPNFIGYKV